jgi:hypothetical protein
MSGLAILPRVRSRPLIRVQHTRAVAGEPLALHVELTGRSRTPIDAVEIALRCVETSWYGHGKGRRRHRATHVDELLTFDGLVLEAGARHAIDVTIPLPREAPPSYDGRELQVSWGLGVHAIIPWWPDLRRTYALEVARAPGLLPRPEVIVASSEAGGPTPGKLYLEATLASTDVAPGEVVAGRVSLDHVEASRLRAVRIALVARERGVVARRVNEGEVRRWLGQLAAEKPPSGVSIPFEVRLPVDAPPSFRGALGSVEWTVEAIADVAFAIDKSVSMPLLVEPPRKRAGRVEAGAQSAPLVGRERRAAAWAAAAKRVGLAHEPEEERMTGAVGRVAVDVGVDARGRCAAALRWAPLGLGLEVKPRRGVLGSLRARVPDDGPEWMAPFRGAFSVEVRDARQIVELLSEDVQRLLANADAIGLPFELDDEGARAELPRAPQSERALVELMQQVTALATALDRGLERVPAPEVTWRWQGAWRNFCQAHGARLESGRLFAHGAEIDGDLVDVGLEWGGRDEARGTRVVLRLPTALREVVRLDRDGAGRRPTERELIGALQAAGDEVRIGPSTIELLLPAVALDPRAVLPIVAVMARLSRLLIGTPRAAAPYR